MNYLKEKNTEYVCPKCEFRFKDIDAGSDLGCPVDWCPRYGEPCDVDKNQYN